MKFRNNVVLIFLLHIYNLKDDGKTGFNKIMEKNGYLKKYLLHFNSISKVAEVLFMLLWPIIYVLYVHVYIIRFLTGLIFYKKKHFRDDSLFLALEYNIVDRSKKAGLYQDNLYWFNRPSKTISSRIKEKNLLTVNDFIHIAEVGKIYINCFKVFCALWKKFSYAKTIYALQFSEYHLVWNALNKVEKDVTLYTGTQRDRWVILVDKLPHKRKIILQHGIEDPVNDRMRYKVKNFTELYAFNPTEAHKLIAACLQSEPLIHCFTSGLKLEKIADPKKSVLIIGHWKTELEKELYIIEHLQNSGFRIFLKNHPTLDKSMYFDYMSDYEFTLLDNTVFPDIDYIVSYDSTLALEYEIAGKHVYKYENFEKLDEIVNLLLDETIS